MQKSTLVHINNATLSQLIIVDMQTKLAPAMPATAMVEVIKNCGILAQAAKLLNVTIIVTEQYAKGLGETLPEIQQFLPHHSVIAKTAFSACSEPRFNQQLSRDKPQIILAGMEAHICILQTALALLQTGKQVFVVEDAITSRSELHKNNAITRMREAGCIISNTESVIFEWIGNANHELAKAIFNMIK